MTDAYKCDKCGEYKDGNPKHGATFGMKEYDFCHGCFVAIRKFIENPNPEDRLDTEHHNAPKDSNGDPEGI